MKSTIFFFLFLFLFYVNPQAQTYYHMWRGNGDAGRPEWIANLATRGGAEHTGIDFTTASKSRGFVNGTGKWGFISPKSLMEPESLSNIINGIDNVTVGIQGWLGAEGVSVRTLWDRVTNTLDLLTTGTRSTITSNGDSEGLHIRSAVGKKIYLYDRIYFNNKYWTGFGAGRHDDPTINNIHSKMFRIGSTGGLGFWGGEGVEENDTPQLRVNNAEVRINVPLMVKANDMVGMGMGVSTDIDTGWLGTTTNHGLYLGTNNKYSCLIGTDQNLYVGLGKNDITNIREDLKTKFNVFVSKGILSADYAIAPQNTWADFVFSETYSLPEIAEVEFFVKENGHLPGVPSATEVSCNGYSQHDMNKVLLQKIEELTLYTIQQQKEIELLRKEIELLGDK